MARPRHYSPVIDRFLVCVLYHDARRHGIPMTRRLDQLLRESLEGSEAWAEARESRPVREEPTTRPSPPARKGGR